MASDSMLDSQPRGVLTVSAAEPDGLRLFDVDLGETGPVRIERLLLAGRYRLAVHSQTFLGRTYTIGYRQDVLPVGRIDLGVVDIGTGASGPITLPFDLSVRRAQIQVDGAQQLTAGSAHTMLRLVSETGDPFWAELPPGGGAVTMLLYSGCYRTHVYGSDQNAYPSVGSVANDPLLGEVCTCDRASP
jgi:hypothetical protein